MKPVVRQMPLDLPHRPALGRADFMVSSANAEAVAMLDAWRDWPARRIALVGPPRSGKTHLAHVWMAASGAIRTTATGLDEAAAPALAEAGAVIVEDADRIADMPDPAERRAAERGLFHLYNLLGAEGGHLMLTGALPPAAWRIETPDLASRLASLALARISEPDDVLLCAVMIKLFADRQLNVGPEVVTYLSRRIDRSFEAAEDAVAYLDAVSLDRGRAITRALAADYISGMETARAAAADDAPAAGRSGTSGD